MYRSLLCFINCYVSPIAPRGLPISNLLSPPTARSYVVPVKKAASGDWQLQAPTKNQEKLLASPGQDSFTEIF